MYKISTLLQANDKNHTQFFFYRNNVKCSILLMGDIEKYVFLFTYFDINHEDKKYLYEN